VGSDWCRFQALAARGYGAGEEGAEDLRRALELVRGRPFEGAKPRSYGWAQLQEAPVMESAIVDLADHLAGLLLRAGDLAGAQWAARRGLATAPYDERLYRRLMLLADAAGNPAGVGAVMDELLLRLDEEHLEPYDSLHEETRTLYERLTRHRATRHRDAG
jgi:DNA-binding SARP family transcriptional activator